MTITETAASVFRDMEAPGSSVAHEPDKAEIRSLFGEVDEAINDATGVVNTGRVEYATYAALAATTATAGQAGGVYPTDVGTHTDPVVGGTVNNAGLYSYSTSPAGWRRIGDYRALEVATLAEANTGTNATKAITPDTLKDTYWTDREYILCEVFGTPTSTAISIKPINPTTRLAGTGADYILAYECPVTKGVGSYNVDIYQNDGTTHFVGPIALRTHLNEALPTGLPVAGDLVEMTRDLDGATYWKTIHRADAVTEPLARVLSSVINTGENPSIIRPMHARKITPNEWFVDVMPHRDHYVGSTADGNRARSDRIRFVLFDLGDAMQQFGGVPMLNSIFSRMSFVEQSITNQRFTDIVGVDADTGHVPSVFEPVIILGDYSTAANSTNFQLAGQAHAHVEDAAWSMDGERAGVMTTGLADDPLLTEYYGDSLISTSTGFLTSPTAQILGSYEYVITFGQESDYQVRTQTTFDFTIPEQEAEPGTREGGYAAMVPLMDCNRLVVWVAGARQAIQTIYKQDGTTTLLDLAEKAIAWHTSNPTVQLVWENGAPSGYTHWSNDAPVAQTAQAFVINNTWGSKFYVPMYPTTGKESLAGEVLTFDSSLKIISADPIT